MHFQILFVGLFGFVILSILLVPMYYIKVGNSIFNNPGGRMEDALDGFTQIKNNWRVALALSGMYMSIIHRLLPTKQNSSQTPEILGLEKDSENFHRLVM